VSADSLRGRISPERTEIHGERQKGKAGDEEILFYPSRGEDLECAAWEGGKGGLPHFLSKIPV